MNRVGNALCPPIIPLTAIAGELSNHQPVTYSPWEGTALAPLFTLAGWVWVRRYRFTSSAVIGWTVFVFLFGIVGLLVLLVVPDWPARENCPGCRKLRVVDRETCEHCGAAFPAPAPTGTEIF
jgi:hypothetical protein